MLMGLVVKWPHLMLCLYNKYPLPMILNNENFSLDHQIRHVDKASPGIYAKIEIKKSQ